jgi:hypothetical protein
MQGHCVGWFCLHTYHEFTAFPYVYWTKQPIGLWLSVMLTLIHLKGRTPRFTHCCIRRSPNKTKSTPTRLALFPHAALGSAPICGARLSILPDVACGCPLLFLVHAACKLRLSTTGPTRHAARPPASLPCRVATAEPLLTSIPVPLPSANSTCLQASILQATRICLRWICTLQASVSSVSEVCCKCFIRMLQK